MATKVDKATRDRVALDKKVGKAMLNMDPATQQRVVAAAGKAKSLSDLPADVKKLVGGASTPRKTGTRKKK